MKYIFRGIAFISGFCIFMLLLTMLLPDPFGRAYQRALVYQYKYYKSLQGNKITVVGNSSLSFGFDLDRMEELTGKPCAILGNHYGYGMSFLMEMSKSNMQEGDIIVLELVDNYIDTCGEALLLTGIGHEYEMYKFFIPEVRWKVLSYYPSYLKDVISYNLNAGYKASGTYSMDSYDERGNMILDRPECVIPDPYTKEVAETYKYKTFSGEAWDPLWIKYVKDYIAYCNLHGVKVYITLPCCYDKAVLSSKEDIDAFDEMMKKTFGNAVISKQSDYIFDRKYIFDGILHCNNTGAKYRTEQIYRDMLNAGALPASP